MSVSQRTTVFRASLRQGWLPACAVAALLLVAACGTDATSATSSGRGPGGSGVIDADNDGHPEGQDCDDNNAAIYPGADETCDGVDNDCDQEIDEDPVDGTLFYADDDTDGFGDPAVAITRCSPPDGHVSQAGDCNDDDAKINPDATEICNGIDDNCNDATDEGVISDGDGCKDPGQPAFPGVIDTLTVTLRTDTGTNDGTDSNELSLCLNAQDCFELDLADVNDFERGESSTFYFEGIDIARADVDRIEITSKGGDDMYSPACLEVQFDGEHVYCKADMGMKFGDNPGNSELESWVDPMGLHVDCTSCYPTGLTHGPMVGTTGPDRVKLWLRTNATRKASLRVAASTAALQAAQPVAHVYPAVANDYARAVDIEGLEPNTTYFYDVETAGERSDARYFTTASPTDSATKLRFSFGSCSKVASQPIFAHIQIAKPDLFFFIGDNHYANSDDLGSLRWYYRWSLERPQRKTLVSLIPTLATWDDHDFTGNNTNGFEPGKDTALRVFTEYWANPSFGTSQSPGVFTRYDYGDISFFFLDDRYYRATDGTLLGQNQTNWLVSELKASNATFKFLISGSQFTLHGSADSWASFPSAQDALFDVVRDEKINGVALLSGDVHYSEFRLIQRSNQGGYDIPELTSSPLATTNSSCGSNDSERLSCFDDDDYFIQVDVDTTANDPVVQAAIIDSAGASKATMSFALSEVSM